MNYGVVETCQKCNKKYVVVISGQYMNDIPVDGTGKITWQCPECGFKNEMPVVQAKGIAD